MNKETEVYNRGRWRLNKYDNDDRPKWINTSMASRMREEKVVIISPQEAKKRALDRTFRPTPERLESALPKCARAVALTTVELFALGGACLLNRRKCRFKHVLLSEFVPSCSGVCGTTARVMRRAILCLLSFIFCVSFWPQQSTNPPPWVPRTSVFHTLSKSSPDASL